MPGTRNIYALNLYFDPNDTTGRFENRRDWFESSDGGSSWGPPMDATATPLTVKRKDKVQFTVAPTSAHETVKSVQIVVTFGKIEKDTGTLVTSPFEDDSGAPRCLLNDSSTHFEAGDFHAQYIGPYEIGKLDPKRAGAGLLRFEFVIVARVTFTKNGVETVKDYGYDPEMDVSV